MVIESKKLRFALLPFGIRFDCSNGHFYERHDSDDLAFARLLVFVDAVHNRKTEAAETVRIDPTIENVRMLLNELNHSQRAEKYPNKVTA